VKENNVISKNAVKNIRNLGKSNVKNAPSDKFKYRIISKKASICPKQY
jgi:hypothetical protein